MVLTCSSSLATYDVWLVMVASVCGGVRSCVHVTTTGMAALSAASLAVTVSDAAPSRGTGSTNVVLGEQSAPALVDCYAELRVHTARLMRVTLSASESNRSKATQTRQMP